MGLGDTAVSVGVTWLWAKPVVRKNARQRHQRRILSAERDIANLLILLLQRVSMRCQRAHYLLIGSGRHITIEGFAINAVTGAPELVHYVNEIS